jgi:hypothetical protein
VISNEKKTKPDREILSGEPTKYNEMLKDCVGEYVSRGFIRWN